MVFRHHSFVVLVYILGFLVGGAWVFGVRDSVVWGYSMCCSEGRVGRRVWGLPLRVLEPKLECVRGRGRGWGVSNSVFVHHKIVVSRK